ncbi:MAG: hypothetical protein EP329_18655 [Deltaproteobacteria bacterium]|nr:MAG: hypothetical protein EP329_18655 [Deltaproteobacteria bacterium]
MPNGDERRPHLLVSGTAQAEPYTYPKEGGGGGFDRPPRNRAGHSARLLADLDQAHVDIDARRSAEGAVDLLGMTLELESEPGFELALDKLDRRRDGIELASVRQRGTVTLATIFVAEGKLSKLEDLVRAYRDENDKRYQRPKNRTLVESVSALRAAAIESFWEGIARCWCSVARDGERDLVSRTYCQCTLQPAVWHVPSRLPERGADGTIEVSIQDLCREDRLRTSNASDAQSGDGVGGR